MSIGIQSRHAERRLRQLFEKVSKRLSCGSTTHVTHACVGTFWATGWTKSMQQVAALLALTHRGLPATVPSKSWICAGFLKTKLGSLNCFPPPHKPVFQDHFDENSVELLQMIHSAGLDLKLLSQSSRAEATSPRDSRGSGRNSNGGNHSIVNQALH